MRLAALVSQKNVKEAARATGINLKTEKRWTQMPEFLSEYRRVRREFVDHAYARGQENSGVATTVLLTIVLLKLLADQSIRPPAGSGQRRAFSVCRETRSTWQWRHA